MANPTENGIYIFSNAASLKGANKRALNVYSSSATNIGNATNVCLWSYNSNDIMQQWKVVSTSNGYKLKAAGGTVSFFLAKNSSNNAITNSTEAVVNFETVYNIVNRVKIYTTVSGTKYYLTASSTDGNSAGGTSTTSKGNVFWSTSTSLGNRQFWDYFNAPVTNTSSDIRLTYVGQYISQKTYNLETAYLNGLSLSGWQNNACGVVTAMYCMRMMDRDTSYMPEDVYDCGFVPIGSCSMTWNNGTTPCGFTSVLQSGNWNAVKTTIFDELMARRPVSIYLEGTGMHFVAACGLKAGTSRTNITRDDIFVKDPWEGTNETLEDVRNYSPAWGDVKSIRYFV